MTRSPNTLLFDLDGTLIDSAVGITRCICYALERLGIEPPAHEALRTWIGPPLRTSFMPLLRDPQQVERAVSLYRERFEDVGWSEHVAYPGIAEAIAALVQAGYRLAVVTAKHEPHARRIVEHLPFGMHFCTISGASADGRIGEKLELIAQALRRLAVAADTCVMIGDRHMDIDGAQAHGMSSVGVLWGFGTAEELGRATHRVDTPAALVSLFVRG